MFYFEGSMLDVMRLQPAPINRHVHYIDNSVSWLGLPGVNAVIDACENGWQAGWEFAQKELQLLQLPKLRTVRRHKVHADAGDFLDIQKVYSGQLDTAWESSKRDWWPMSKSHSYITLLCDIGGNCNLHASQLMWRGMATMVLADLLQTSGRNVQVIGYDNAKRTYLNEEDASVIIKLKEFDQALMPDQLVACLGLPGFHRYYVFRAWLSYDKRARQNLGWHQSKPPEAYMNDQTILIKNVWDKASAQMLLDDVAQRLNEGVQNES